jgi:hypothetical protein
MWLNLTVFGVINLTNDVVVLLVPSAHCLDPFQETCAHLFRWNDTTIVPVAQEGMGDRLLSSRTHSIWYEYQKSHYHGHRTVFIISDTLFLFPLLQNVRTAL